jgi:TldD protein
LIETDVIEAVLTAGIEGGGEFAEIFVEDRRSTSALLDDGRVEELASGRDRGAGIRVVAGDTTGFAHTADLSERSLVEAARTAAAAARSARAGGGIVDLGRVDAENPSTVEVYPEDVDKEVKVDLLRRAESAARSEGSEITQVSARYADSRRRIQVANSDGVLADDDQVRTMFSVSTVATGDTGMQTGRESTGHTIGFELFDSHDVSDLARSAAKRALTKLSARPAPSGEMTVVIGPGGGGVMFHEACGHGLEADLVAKGASVFAGRVGEQVASPLVTLVDDELRARSEGRTSSGNGRRQSYAHLPMVRMTNTYLLAGESDPDDIVADTPSGVYVAHLGGGQVNTATGDFVFGMTEAYLIEDGRITEPIREGNLIGNGPAVLANIDAVGNDFAMGSPGTCGKDGQGVPVGDGVPTLRAHSLTIGGTAA